MEILLIIAFSILIFVIMLGPKGKDLNDPAAAIPLFFSVLFIFVFGVTLAVEERYRKPVARVLLSSQIENEYNININYEITRTLPKQVERSEDTNEQ